MKARYLNPFTDFGLKKFFGEETSKPRLLRNAEQVSMGLTNGMLTKMESKSYGNA